MPRIAAGASTQAIAGKTHVGQVAPRGCHHQKAVVLLLLADLQQVEGSARCWRRRRQLSGGRGVRRAARQAHLLSLILHGGTHVALLWLARHCGVAKCYSRCCGGGRLRLNGCQMECLQQQISVDRAGMLRLWPQGACRHHAVAIRSAAITRCRLQAHLHLLHSPPSTCSINHSLLIKPLVEVMDHPASAMHANAPRLAQRITAEAYV